MKSPIKNNPPKSLSHSPLRLCFWLVFFACQLVALSLASWHLLAQFHFLYPTGYKLLTLDQHIALYAPQNRYKSDFELTTREEHWRLFGEITEAVQNSGKGLADIHYRLPDAQTVPLMHTAEIVHLQDVANLIDGFYAAGIGCLLLWLGLIYFAWKQKRQPPSAKHILLGFLIAILTIALVIILIGPTSVFYWFHIQMFPDGHQWFFYYEESLMTTLMKAPDIFAFIALLLLTCLIALWSMSTYCINRLLNNARSN